jgi:hypothetical protein
LFLTFFFSFSNSWSHHPLVRPVITGLLREFSTIRDIQTLAIAACVLSSAVKEIQQRNTLVNNSNNSNNRNSTNENVADNFSANITSSHLIRSGSSIQLSHHSSPSTPLQMSRISSQIDIRKYHDSLNSMCNSDEHLFVC